MFNKKGQIERWIVFAIIAIVGAVLLIFLFATGLLPKAFDQVLGLLTIPSSP